MTSVRPYLVRAIYEWLLDNEQTPYVEVDTSYKEVNVPENYIDEDNSIVLDIAPNSVQHLLIDNEGLSCKARFEEISHHIYVPMKAIRSIYSAENEQGMTFPKEEDEAADVNESSTAKRKPKFEVLSGGND
jgi:stringent starvation protein B